MFVRGGGVVDGKLGGGVGIDRAGGPGGRRKNIGSSSRGWVFGENGGGRVGSLVLLLQG
jgi:hypothetical protein